MLRECWKVDGKPAQAGRRGRRWGGLFVCWLSFLREKNSCSQLERLLRGLMAIRFGVWLQRKGSSTSFKLYSCVAVCPWPQVKIHEGHGETVWGYIPQVTCTMSTQAPAPSESTYPDPVFLLSSRSSLSSGCLTMGTAPSCPDRLCFA